MTENAYEAAKNALESLDQERLLRIQESTDHTKLVSDRHQVVQQIKDIQHNRELKPEYKRKMIEELNKLRYNLCKQLKQHKADIIERRGNLPQRFKKKPKSRGR